MRLIRIFAIWVGLSVPIAMPVAASDVRIAVDIAPVHSIVAQIMGDKGQLDLIVPVGASPHDHAMRPSEALNLSKANVVIWVGEGLTPWLHDPIQTLAPTARTIELLDLEQTLVLPFREGADFGAHSHGSQKEDDHATAEHADEHADAKHDDAHGEGHGDDHADEGHDDHGGHEGGDPHVWLDPKNAIAWAYVIADVLGEVDSDNAMFFQENAANFETRMTATTADIQQQVQPIQGKPFIVFHDAFHSFENRFGVEARGAISDSDADAPSPKRVAHLRDLVQSQNIRCVLTEPLFNDGLVKAIAGDANIGAVDPLGVGLTLGPDLYEDLLRAIGTALVECFDT